MFQEAACIWFVPGVKWSGVGCVLNHGIDSVKQLTGLTESTDIIALLQKNMQVVYKYLLWSFQQKCCCLVKNAVVACFIQRNQVRYFEGGWVSLLYIIPLATKTKTLFFSLFFKMGGMTQVQGSTSISSTNCQLMNFHSVIVYNCILFKVEQQMYINLLVV